MPTGYTADIAKGISFEQFVWNCARAFGALVLMRDDPSDAKVPQEFAPAPFYAEHAAAAQATLAAIENLSPEEAQIKARQDYLTRHAEWRKRREERATLRMQYGDMLARAKAWEPPTTEHTGLRDFMVEQIKSSIQFDCGGDSYDTEPVETPWAQWHAEKLTACRRDVAYALKSQADEADRVASRNAWVKALRDSVPQP